MVRAAAQRRGQRPAVICAGRSRGWSDWVQDLARLASGLRSLGVQTGDRVAIVAQNSDRYLDAFYAAAWAGAVVVPVNTRLSIPELAYILQHSGARYIFVDANLGGTVIEAIASIDFEPVLIGFESGDAEHDVAALINGHKPISDTGRKGDDLSGIFYTGGTTGRSKGVMLSHANHIFNSLAMWCGRESQAEQIRYLHAAPMFHVADVEFVYGVTAIGGTHYVIPRFEAGAFLTAVGRWGITDAVLVPTMIQMLLDHPDIASADMSSLKRLWYGGSPMAEATIRRLRTTLPTVSPIQLYGQTEAGPIVSALEPEDHDPNGLHPERLRSAGQAIAGCEVRIVDSAGHDVPTGTIGEIVASSGAVMLGYWEEPAQSAEALQDGWLRTGDAGYIDASGYLFVTDRFKDMIITGGENVYSVEVEQAIYACDGIAQCAVIGVPDSRWGERVHAILVPRPGYSINIGAVALRLRSRLAGYKVPRSFEIRETDLPVSGAGKILKRELRDHVMGRDQS